MTHYHSSSTIVELTGQTFDLVKQNRMRFVFTNRPSKKTPCTSHIHDMPNNKIIKVDQNRILGHNYSVPFTYNEF